MSASAPSGVCAFLCICSIRSGIPRVISFCAVPLSMPSELAIFEVASHLKVDEIREEISTKKKNKRIKILRIIELRSELGWLVCELFLVDVHRRFHFYFYRDHRYQET